MSDHDLMNCCISERGLDTILAMENGHSGKTIVTTEPQYLPKNKLRGTVLFWISITDGVLFLLCKYTYYCRTCISTQVRYRRAVTCPFVRLSVRQQLTCERNFSYSFWPIVLKLHRCFCHSVLFAHNSQIFFFFNFFHFVNLVVFYLKPL